MPEKDRADVPAGLPQVPGARPGWEEIPRNPPVSPADRNIPDSGVARVEPARLLPGPLQGPGPHAQLQLPSTAVPGCHHTRPALLRPQTALKSRRIRQKRRRRPSQHLCLRIPEQLFCRVRPADHHAPFVHGSGAGVRQFGRGQEPHRGADGHMSLFRRSGVHPMLLLGNTSISPNMRNVKQTGAVGRLGIRQERTVRKRPARGVTCLTHPDSVGSLSNPQSVSQPYDNQTSSPG